MIRSNILKNLVIFVACLFVVSSVWGQDSVNRQQNSSPAEGTPAPAGGGACTTSTGADGTELVVDGGFEAGTPNPNWNEASTNFGTPICDTVLCGMGGGTGPFAGTFWAWFGGIAAPETASVDQDVTIPTGTAELSFQFEVPVCDGAATDFLEVNLDGTPVFTHTCGDGLVNPYEPRTVDVSSFADGGTYNLEFTSTSDGSGTSNFFVDVVSLCSAAGDDGPGPGPGEFTAVPTFGLIGAGVLVAVLLVFGGVYMRRTG